MHLFKILFCILPLRLVEEDVGMDIPFSEGVLSPSSTDMRPGERSFY